MFIIVRKDINFVKFWDLVNMDKVDSFVFILLGVLFVVIVFGKKMERRLVIYVNVRDISKSIFI